MSWKWQYETADGTALEKQEELPGEVFSSRGDAESWLGENWRELVEGGTDRVTLFEDEGAVYSMSLHEE